MTREELERMDDQGMKAWDEHDVDGFLSMFADDFVWRDVGVPEPMTTREQVREYMTSYFTAFPDMRATSRYRIIGDDAVAAEVEFRGTHTGPLVMGEASIPATGKSIVGQGAYFVRVADGKITEFSSHSDTAGLLMQLGLMPASMGAPTSGG